jgi:hypothetical protein
MRTRGGVGKSQKSIMDTFVLGAQKAFLRLYEPACVNCGRTFDMGTFVKLYLDGKITLHGDGKRVFCYPRCLRRWAEKSPDE